MVKLYGNINACAKTPDQLTHYVAAISGMTPEMLNGFPFYLSDGQGVLAAFGDGADSRQKTAQAVEQALGKPNLKKLTVLGEHKPEAAPECAQVQTDYYWLLNLPPNPGQKTRNMLTRAARDLRVSQETGGEAITDQHRKLTLEFCQRKQNALDETSRFIFGRMDKYAQSSENVHIFSAWQKDTLAAYAVADFTSFQNVFYMFAFRAQNAPPGAADLLLAAISKEAETQGHTRINLGLGINAGVEFFKKKWGAYKGFPLVETTWELPRKPGFFSKISKIFNKKA